MYSSQGLADWELFVVSGFLALCMLVISALIGSLVAYLALREPRPVAKTVGVRESVQTGEIAPRLPSVPSAA